MGSELEKFSQADELIKALHDMDNNELKFMFYALSQRQKGELEIKTTLNDILRKLNIDIGGNQVKLYQTVIRDIIKKSVLQVEMKAERLPNWEEQGYGKDDIIEVSGAIISAKRNTKTNDVTISFDSDFIPLLDDLKYNHTWIYIEQMAKLEGKYSPRLYEFCKMHLKDKSKTKFIWYLNDDSKKAPGLRQFLNLKNKYEDWRNLKRRVLDPAVAEINEKCSDMFISYNILKTKWVYAIELTLATYDLNKVIDQDVAPGQMSIYDCSETENPRSGKRGSKRDKRLQLVERREELVKFDANKIIYNWLDEEERKKRSK